MNNTEETAIPIVEMTQFKLLSLPTQKKINELSVDLKATSLKTFNPLVQQMTVIEGYKTLKYVADDKTCIEQYKLAKASIKSFRARTKEAKKELKAPLLKTGKSIDEIEKVFIDRATEILKTLDKEYDAYIQQEATKKQEALDKKNKATIEKITEMSQENIEAKIIIERMKAKNAYDNEIRQITIETGTKIATHSREALAKEYDSLNKLEEFYIAEKDISVLLPEQVVEIQKDWNTAVQGALMMLEMKIQQIDDAAKLAAIPEVNPLTQRPVFTGMPMMPPAKPLVEEPIVEEKAYMEFIAPSLTQENPDYFKDQVSLILQDAIESIENLNPANEKEKIVKANCATGLKGLEAKIIAYLS